MNSPTRGWLATIHIVTGMSLIVALVALAGCGHRYPQGSIDDLFIVDQRYNIDKEKGVVRVYARVENIGEGIVRKVRMEAVLRNADGGQRGTNNVVLENIKPGEKRDFSLVVTSHSQGHTVEIVPKEVED